MTDNDCPPREVLSAYVDREANPSEERKVDLHLADCAGCRARVRTLARLKTAVRNQPLPPLSPDLRRALERAARQARQGWGARLAESAARAAGALGEALRARPLAGLGLAGILAALAWSGWRLRAPATVLPVDLILAAHNQYALTMPLASTERILSELPVQISQAGDAGGRDVY
ncbi:MAG: zf-HC2 domain-containing protein [Elusimicrobia bacterium]|nr:zf-HC2 domain-containing protein [Elusimicrobiota bacterium]